MRLRGRGNKFVLLIKMWAKVWEFVSLQMGKSFHPELFVLSLVIMTRQVKESFPP